MKELNNLNFGDLLVGYLDAETEVRYNSDSFEEFFYDLNDTLPKLNNLNEYIEQFVESCPKFSDILVR